MFDDFETQVQIDEIVPEEYEDWLEFLRNEEVKEWEEDFVRSLFVEEKEK